MLITGAYARGKELKLLKLTGSYLLSELVPLTVIILEDLEGLGRREVFEGQQRDRQGGRIFPETGKEKLNRWVFKLARDKCLAV